MELKDFWRLIRDSFFNSIFENSEAKTNGSYLTIVPWPSRSLSAEFNIVYTDRLYGKDKIMYWSEVLSYVLSFEPLNINANNFKCNEKNSRSKRQKGRCIRRTLMAKNHKSNQKNAFFERKENFPTYHEVLLVASNLFAPHLSFQWWLQFSLRWLWWMQILQYLRVLLSLISSNSLILSN